MIVFLKLCHTTVLPFVADCLSMLGGIRCFYLDLTNFFPPSIKCSFFLLYRHLLKNMVKCCIKKMRNIFWRWSFNGASVWSHGNKVLFMWPSPFVYCSNTFYLFLVCSTFVDSEWSFGYFIHATTTNDLRLRRIFIQVLIHYFFHPILIIEKDPVHVFPF